MKVALAVALALVACEGRKKGPVDREAAAKLFEEVPISVPPGMSDLTIDEYGVVWAIAERDRALVEIPLNSPPVVHRLEGIPATMDTEGLAWIGKNRFAIGTEGGIGPAAGIAFAELRGDDVVVTGTRALSNDDLGITLTVNHGIEAVCGREGDLIAASETVGKDEGGRRYAPLVRLRHDQLTVTKLLLSSAKGKISALYCEFTDDGTAYVTAIERHFGVARIVTFALAPDDIEATAKVELDLHPVLRDTYNLEGITKLPDGRLVLINDNQSKSPSGPTHLFVFHKR